SGPKQRTTTQSASTSRSWAIPCAEDVPPGTSTNRTCAWTRLRDRSISARTSTRESGTGTTAWLACPPLAPARVSAVKSVDLPEKGSPTRPMSFTTAEPNSADRLVERTETFVQCADRTPEPIPPTQARHTATGVAKAKGGAPSPALCLRGAGQWEVSVPSATLGLDGLDQAAFVSQKIFAISSIASRSFWPWAGSSDFLAAPASFVAFQNSSWSCGYFSKCSGLK